MGMKIWAAEKLHRILAHMFDDSASHGHNTRGNNIPAATGRVREEDLSQVLRNEKHNGLVDRDPSAFTKDLVLFKGPFIYIHDMDGKTRPTMVREYPKVARRQDGAWPQFRSATVGKCPFIEDHVSRKELEREREKERAMALQLEREAQQALRTRSVTTVDTVQMDPPSQKSPRKALREVSNVPNANLAIASLSKPIDPPKVERHTAVPPALDAPPVGFIRPTQMHFAREPAASGMQQSNLTSAIRSNMISSTAAAPGAKAGTSKEVHELKRKVLERSNTGSLSVGSMPSSHRMTDLAGHLKNARAPAPQRAAKSKAQEKLGGIQEDDPSEEELAAERAAHASSRKRAAKKDPKPGYCENCRDKYDDFDEVRMHPSSSRPPLANK
jgi:regulatory subunit for Cdc7p protein kinase